MADQFDSDGMPKWAYPYGSEPDTVRPEWEDQRIRIEALRAAAQLAVANIAANNKRPSDSKLEDMVIGTAEQFAKWLETGEG